MDAAAILALAQQSAAATRVVQDSVWGAATILVASVLGTAIYTLWKDGRAKDQERNALQAQRVADAQAVTAQLLRINESCVTALTNNSTMLEALQESMSELKQAFRELERSLPRRPGG